MNLRKGALLALVSLLACSLVDPLTTGVYPPGTHAFAPLDSYAALWRETEACSGIAAPLAAVNWFRVDNTTSFVYGGSAVAGYFVVPNNIVLADAWLADTAVVAHEMLHALLYAKFGAKFYATDDRGQHPHEYFLERCPFVSQAYAH